MHEPTLCASQSDAAMDSAVPTVVKTSASRRFDSFTAEVASLAQLLASSENRLRFTNGRGWRPFTMEVCVLAASLPAQLVSKSFLETPMKFAKDTKRATGPGDSNIRREPISRILIMHKGKTTRTLSKCTHLEE